MTTCVECEEIKDYAGVLDVAEPAPDVDPRGDELTRWSGMIAPWETATGDRRTFAQDSLEHRPLPLPLKWQRSDNGGHTTSITIGTIEGIEYQEEGVFAWGILLDPDPTVMPRLAEDVAEARLLLDKKAVAPSVDLAAMEAVADDPTGQYAATGGRPDIRVLSGEIGAVTLVPVAAFKEVRPFALDQIQVGEYESLVASARAEVPVRRDWADVPVAFQPWDAAAWLAHELDQDEDGSMTASALYRGDVPLFPVGQYIGGELHLIPGAVADAISVFSLYEERLPFDVETRGVMKATLAELAERCDLPAPPWDVAEGVSLTASAAPVAPPDDWFATQEPDHLQPFVITDDGRVYGHVADPKTCHVGFPGQCKTAPKSRTNYALAHTGYVVTASGANLPVGRVTLGGGHADLKFGVRAAQEHYDDAANCVAIGRYTDGRHGIWFSGALVPEATPEQAAALRRHPPSGDWRNFNGHPEMILAHAVNTGGFPVPRYRLDGSQVHSLVAAGAVYAEPEPADELDAAAAVFRTDDGLDAAVLAFSGAGLTAAAAVFRK